MSDIKRIKFRLGLKRQEPAITSVAHDSVHRIFGKASKHLPWYSLLRIRNAFIYAGFISCLVMSKPLYDLYNGIRMGINLERERTAYRKELQNEDKLTQQQQSGSSPK